MSLFQQFHADKPDSGNGAMTLFWGELELRMELDGASCKAHESTRSLELGQFSLIRSCMSPRVLRRRPVPNEDEFLVTAIVEQGALELRRGDQVSRLSAGTMCVSTSRQGLLWHIPETTTLHIALLPRTLVRLPDDRLKVALDRWFPEAQASAAMYGATMRTLFSLSAPPLTAAQNYLANALLEHISAYFAEALQPSPEHLPAARRDVLLLAAREFITERLFDAALTPEVVAAHLHISLRYLHKLFASIGLSVSSWIRASRIERCRRDLADPDLAHLTIAEIGSRWGMPNATLFSRNFKDVVGETPSAYRKRLLRGADEEATPV